MLKSLIYLGGFLGLISLGHAICRPVLNFEGAYKLKFECETKDTCPPSVRALKQMAIIGTSPPEILTGGLGLVVSIIDEGVSPAYFFYDATFDPLQSRLTASTSGGRFSQAGSLVLSTQAEIASQSLNGVLRDLNASGSFKFKAIPIRTVSEFFPDIPDFSMPTSGIEGVYRAKWGKHSGTFVLKSFGQSNNVAEYSGRFTYDEPKQPYPMRVDFHSGFLNVQKGLLNLVMDSGIYPTKIFIAYHDGVWDGFTISSRLGGVVPMHLEKIKAVEP